MLLLYQGSVFYLELVHEICQVYQWIGGVGRSRLSFDFIS